MMRADFYLDLNSYSGFTGNFFQTAADIISLSCADRISSVLGCHNHEDATGCVSIPLLLFINPD